MLAGESGLRYELFAEVKCDGPKGLYQPPSKSMVIQQDDLALLLHPTRPRVCRLLNISWQREDHRQFVFLQNLKKTLSKK